MQDFNKILLSKNGLATTLISKELLKYSVGDKIPTVTEFSSLLNLVRGTTQNALKTLLDNDAIRIESKGHLGSYLTRKNTKLLLEFAGISSIVGVMPLPYSKKYEGLASGLIATMENIYDIPINLAYMRGANNRISMLLQDRYDFAILSKFAALSYLENNRDDIEIIIEFGDFSYLNSHVIMFHDKKATKIEDGMKVGIDISSVDQTVLTKKVCENKNVEFIPTEYSKLIRQIIDGKIDATVMNIDEAIDNSININYKHIETLNKDNTIAVIVTKKESEGLNFLLKEFINIESVLNIQKLVEEGKITPSY